MSKEKIQNYFDIVEDVDSSTNFLIVLRNFDIFDGWIVDLKSIEIEEDENGEGYVHINYECEKEETLNHDKKMIFQQYLSDIVAYLIKLQLEYNINVADIGKINSQESNKE